MGGTFDGVSRRLDGSGSVDANASQTGPEKVLQYVQQSHVAEALQRHTRKQPLFQAQEILFSFVREYEADSRKTRKQLAGTPPPEDRVRTVSGDHSIDSPSHRPGPIEQYFRKHPDALRELSCLVASRGETPWSNPLWESAVPRTGTGINNRQDRLRCLGNAVVPQVAARAWHVLHERLSDATT